MVVSSVSWASLMGRTRKHQRLGRSGRRVNVRRQRDNFLIVCEGEKTEPGYFESFRVSKRVKVTGLGMNTVTLVEEALRLREKDSYSQVWCVFDRDSFPVEDFNEAISLAQRSGMNVAYSNEAFELWYLLHFNYHDAATARELYGQMLGDRLGIPYRKSMPGIYALLEPYQRDAIRNAERLIASYPEPRPSHDNPSTTVHDLVKELLRFAV